MSFPRVTRPRIRNKPSSIYIAYTILNLSSMVLALFPSFDPYIQCNLQQRTSALRLKIRQRRQKAANQTSLRGPRHKKIFRIRKRPRTRTGEQSSHRRTEGERPQKPYPRAGYAAARGLAGAEKSEEHSSWKRRGTKRCQLSRRSLQSEIRPLAGVPRVTRKRRTSSNAVSVRGG
jgi:hypothetical protein